MLADQESLGFLIERSITLSRTLQLRRYTLDPQLAPQFLEFLKQKVFPARIALGFTVEQVLLAKDKTSLTWLVSAPGDEADFRRLDQAWISSDERSSIFTDAPRYVSAQKVDFVSFVEF